MSTTAPDASDACTITSSPSPATGTLSGTCTIRKRAVSAVTGVSRNGAVCTCTTHGHVGVWYGGLCLYGCGETGAIVCGCMGV